MKIHPDMKKDITKAMDAALREIPLEKLAKLSWFSTIEEAEVRARKIKG